MVCIIAALLDVPSSIITTQYMYVALSSIVIDNCLTPCKAVAYRAAMAAAAFPWRKEPVSEVIQYVQWGGQEREQQVHGLI